MTEQKQSVQSTGKNGPDQATANSKTQAQSGITVVQRAPAKGTDGTSSKREMTSGQAQSQSSKDSHGQGNLVAEERNSLNTAKCTTGQLQVDKKQGVKRLLPSSKANDGPTMLSEQQHDLQRQHKSQALLIEKRTLEPVDNQAQILNQYSDQHPQSTSKRPAENYPRVMHREKRQNRYGYRKPVVAKEWTPKAD